MAPGTLRALGRVHKAAARLELAVSKLKEKDEKAVSIIARFEVASAGRAAKRVRVRLGAALPTQKKGAKGVTE